MNFKHYRLPVYLFVTLCLAIVGSPLVLASTDGAFNRGQSYALALLGLVVASLFVYLFVVIFQPEKF